MATLIIGHGAILNAPIVMEQVSEPQSSRQEEPSPANAQIARNLELHERGNLYWWRQQTSYTVVRQDALGGLAGKCLAKRIRREQENLSAGQKRRYERDSSGDR